MKNLKKYFISKVFIFLIAFLVIILSMYQLYTFVNKKNSNQDIKKLYFEELKFARTSEEKETGLMNVEYLCDKCGMVFIFENEQFLNFWMKDTLISLDIIYLDKDLQIVNIHRNTKTNQTSQIYPSKGLAKYVLEVNAGYSVNNNLEDRNIIEFFDSKQNKIVL